MRGGGSRRPKAPAQSRPPGRQPCPVMATSRPARGEQGEGRAHVEQVRPAPLRSTPGVVVENGGFMSTTEGRTWGRQSPMASALWRVHGRFGEQSFQHPRTDGGELVQVQRPRGPAAEGALGQHRQHPGPGGGLQHHVARTHLRGLEHRVGERQGRGELLAGDLPLGAPGVGGLQGGQRLQHREHPLGGPRLAAHGAAPALEEQHERGLGRLVGVLPHPDTLGVGAAEGAGEDRAQGGRIQGLSRLQPRQEGRGGGEQGAGLRGDAPGARGRRRTGEQARRAGARAHPPPGRRRAWRFS